jgi:magnesium-transporting ATPase (P-type)
MGNLSVRVDPASGGVAWHALSAQETLTLCAVHKALGLSSGSAESRLVHGHENRITISGANWRSTLHRAHVLIFLILAAITIGLSLRGLWLDALLVLGVAMVNLAMFIRNERRCRRVLRALTRLASVQAHVLRDGSLMDIPPTKLVPGDVLFLEPGDIVPADARLIDAHGLQCNEAAVTGTHAVAEKETEPVGANTRIRLRKGMVFLGTVVLSGTGKAVVVRTGPETEAGKILVVGGYSTPLPDDSAFPAG